MVFVTVGSQKFQFNRLLRAVDDLVASGGIKERVVCQSGYSDYTPRNFECTPFLDRDGFSDALQDSSVVITHAGTGVIVGSLKRGKRVIAMPRLKKYGEHVDDHQIQLLEPFQQANYIEVAVDESDLSRAFDVCSHKQYAPFVSNNSAFVCDLEKYLFSEV